MKAALIFLILSISYVSCTVKHVPLTRVHTAPIAKVYTEALPAAVPIASPYTLLANISIGTPPQNLTVFLDTTRSDFWVADVSLAASGRNTFDSTASSTFYAASGNLDDSDGDSDASTMSIYGNLGVDTLVIANATVKNVFFGQATGMTNVPASFDGILGMAFAQDSVDSYTSCMEDILGDNQFVNKSFSIFMSNTSSALVLGGVEQKYAKSAFQYVPLIGDGLWSFIGRVSFGSVSLGHNVEIMIGTGIAESVLLPPHIFKNFRMASNISPYNYFQADVLDVFRPIEIQVGSVTLTIPASTYMYLGSDGYYQLNVHSQNAYPSMVILGDCFLERYYTHFDYEHMRLGFAEAADM